MFGIKQRRIEWLEDQLQKSTLQAKLEFQNNNKLEDQLREAQEAKVAAIAQVENLREQLLRANEIRDQATAELQKAQEKLAHAQEELRNAQEATARSARADSWGNARAISEELHEAVKDTQEYDSEDKSSAS